MQELDSSAINISAENFSVYVSADTSLKKLDDELAKHKQESLLIAPEDYGIGKILSENWNNDCHKSCLGLELEHHNGNITKTGGQVIKNVSGYDLSKIYIGSDNELVKIKSAYLRTSTRANNKFTLEHKFAKLPNNLHEYIFNWDNYKSEFKIQDKEITLKIELWENDDILELRKEKVVNKLRNLGLIEPKISTTTYSKSYEAPLKKDDIKLELYSKITDLALISQSLSPDFNLRIIPQYGKIEIYIKRDQINTEKLIKLMNCNNAYTHIYPINKTNKDLEKRINLNPNLDEEAIYQKVKEVYAS